MKKELSIVLGLVTYIFLFIYFTSRNMNIILSFFLAVLIGLIVQTAGHTFIAFQSNETNKNKR